MKATTKVLREKMKRDIRNIYYRNNSKDEKRTIEQVKQSYNDRINRIRSEWEETEIETAAQAAYKENVLRRLYILEDRRDFVIKSKGGQ